MRYFILFFAVMLSINLHAQHCPYDGSNLIAVKLVDKKGKLINVSKDTLYLVEIDNPRASACTYAEGLLKKPLLDLAGYFSARSDRFGSYYDEKLKHRLKDMGVSDNANLFIGLNQAEKDCMIKKNSDFDYRSRKFVIIYNSGNKKISVPVPPDAIRSLCTESKDFINFQPIVITL